MKKIGMMALGGLAIAGLGWGLGNGTATAAPVVLRPPPPTATPMVATLTPPKLNVRFVPLTSAERLQHLSVLLKKPKSAGDLGVPFRFSARSMYIDAHTQASALGINQFYPSVTADDGSKVPYLEILGNGVLGGHTYFAFGWHALANKAYYYDCVVAGSSDPGAYKVVSSGAGSNPDMQLTGVVNGHIKNVILPSPADRDVGVSLIPQKNVQLAISYCEVTPVN